MQTKFPEVNVMRAAAQSPAAQSVFAEINRRHGEDEDVVQRHGDRRCNLIAPANPRHQDGKQRFERIKRREPEKDSDRGPERNRMRRVRHGDQRHVMVGQPLFLSLEP